MDVDGANMNIEKPERMQQFESFASGNLSRQHGFGISSSDTAMDGDHVISSCLSELEELWALQDKAWYEQTMGCTLEGAALQNKKAERSEYQLYSENGDSSEPTNNNELKSVSSHEFEALSENEFEFPNDIRHQSDEEETKDSSLEFSSCLTDKEVFEAHQAAIENADRLIEAKQISDPAEQFKDFYEKKPKVGDVAVYVEPKFLRLQHPDYGRLVAIKKDLGHGNQTNTGVFAFYRSSRNSKRDSVPNNSDKFPLFKDKVIPNQKLSAYYDGNVKRTDAKMVFPKNAVPEYVPGCGVLVAVKSVKGLLNNQNEVYGFYRQQSENSGFNHEVSDGESDSEYESICSWGSKSNLDSDLGIEAVQSNSNANANQKATEDESFKIYSQATTEIDLSAQVFSGTSFVNRLPNFSQVVAKTLARAAIFSVIFPFVAAKTVALAGVRILDLSFKDIRNLISDEPMIKRAMGPTYMKMRSGDFKSKLLAKTFRLMDAAILPGVVTVQPWVLAISLVPTFFYAVLDSAHYSVQLSNMANKQFKALTAKKSDNLDLEAAGKKFA